MARNDGARVREPLQSSLEQRANLGCGDDYRSDWLNVDIDPDVRVDARFDLEDTPWPLPDDHFQQVLLDNVFEHLDPRTRPAVLDECHRILRLQGQLVMRLPTRVGWAVDHYAVPTHQWPYSPRYCDDWEVMAISGRPIGPGRVLPEPIALRLTEWDVVRCLREVEIRVRPAGGGDGGE